MLMWAWRLNFFLATRIFWFFEAIGGFGEWKTNKNNKKLLHECSSASWRLAGEKRGFPSAMKSWEGFWNRQEFKVFEVSKHEFVLHWLLYINTSMPHLHQYLDLMSQFMCVMIFDPAEKIFTFLFIDVCMVSFCLEKHQILCQYKCTWTRCCIYLQN